MPEKMFSGIKSDFFVAEMLPSQVNYRAQLKVLKNQELFRFDP